MPSQERMVKTVRGPLFPQNQSRYITPNSVAELLNSNQNSSRSSGK